MLLSPWLTIHGVGYPLPPQAIGWSILENTSSKFNHRNLYVLLPTVPLALHKKPQSPRHRNSKYFYKMSCSSLSLWVLKDDTWVKGLVKSHMIWKLRIAYESYGAPLWWFVSILQLGTLRIKFQYLENTISDILIQYIRVSHKKLRHIRLKWRDFAGWCPNSHWDEWEFWRIAFSRYHRSPLNNSGISK